MSRKPMNHGVKMYMWGDKHQDVNELVLDQFMWDTPEDAIRDAEENLMDNRFDLLEITIKCVGSYKLVKAYDETVEIREAKKKGE